MRAYIQECLNIVNVCIKNVYFNFNTLAINQPHAKVPYSQLKPSNVIGLPVGMTLQHPSQLTQENALHMRSRAEFSTVYILEMIT